MQFRILNKELALTDGADLWILPSFAYSEWTRRLDWPLNLQITRAVYHPSPELPVELKRIVDENELHFDFKQTGGKPLLIASAGLLPNRITAVVDGDQWEQWLITSLKLWKDLLQPGLRLFLPYSSTWTE